MRLDPPEEFIGQIKETDLDGLEKRDRKVLLTMSIFGQWIDWIVQALIVQNRHQRHIEAEQIRLHDEIEKARLATGAAVATMEKTTAKMGWQWEFLRWVAMTIGAGLIAAGSRWLIK